jgi:hypothetical protein
VVYLLGPGLVAVPGWYHADKSKSKIMSNELVAAFSTAGHIFNFQPLSLRFRSWHTVYGEQCCLSSHWSRSPSAARSTGHRCAPSRSRPRHAASVHTHRTRAFRRIGSGVDDSKG